MSARSITYVQANLLKPLLNPDHCSDHIATSRKKHQKIKHLLDSALVNFFSLLNTDVDIDFVA